MHLDSWLVIMKEQLEDYMAEEKDVSYYEDLENLHVAITNVQEEITRVWRKTDD